MEIAGKSAFVLGLCYLLWKNWAKNRTKSVIPVVDLTQSPEQCAKVIEKACLEHGFFYLVNHGLDPFLQAQLISKSKALFGLGLDEKLKIRIDEKYRGFEGKTDDINPNWKVSFKDL